jgi:hypothetical protein
MLDGFSNLLQPKYAVVGTVEDGKRWSRPPFV